MARRSSNRKHVTTWMPATEASVCVMLLLGLFAKLLGTVMLHCCCTNCAVYFPTRFWANQEVLSITYNTLSWTSYRATVLNQMINLTKYCMSILLVSICIILIMWSSSLLFSVPPVRTTVYMYWTTITRKDRKVAEFLLHLASLLFPPLKVES